MTASPERKTGTTCPTWGPGKQYATVPSPSIHTAHGYATPCSMNQAIGSPSPASYSGQGANSITSRKPHAALW